MKSILSRLILTAPLIVGFAASALHAQSASAPATTAPATTAPVIDAKAADVLRKISDYYKSLKSAQVQITMATKFSQGQHKEESNATATFAIERPGKLALVVSDEKNGGGSVVTDGKMLWLTIAELKKYSQEPAMSLDDLVNSPAETVARQALILFPLFHSQPYEQLLSGVITATYVGQDAIDGVQCDHILLAQDEVDLNLWTVAGDKPLLRRLKPDLTRQYKRAVEQGQPDMKDATFDSTVDFKDWKIDQPVPADQFIFSPPAGTDKMEYMEEVIAGDQPAIKLKGTPAPNLTFDLLGGGKVSLADHKGKDIIVLDFWATWCPPCVQTLPMTAQIAKDHAAQHVIFFAMNMQEEESEIVPFLKQHHLDLPVGLDKDGAVTKACMVNGLPQTMIIGKDGVIKAVHIGMMGSSLKTRMQRDLEKVLAEN